MSKPRSDRIAESLEEKIFNGTLSDGDRLDETRLAEEFGVSRTPVREAFHRLSNSGLVEQIPNRGVFVRQPGPIELLELFEAMAELEAVCARLAVQGISDAALEELNVANQACLKMAKQQDADGYYHENEVFHAIIYRESGNQVLEQLAQQLHRRLKPFRRLQLRARGRINQSMQEHENIIAAITKGDGEGAAHALRSHVAIQGEKFQGLLKSLKDSNSQINSAKVKAKAAAKS
jgi:DNA-binding GntR family transcriptional regulator